MIMDYMLGSIVQFAGNYAPVNFALCNGALIPLSQNTALYSLLGDTFGGDARTVFGLPDLQGRTAIGAGQGPGLPAYQWGQRVGAYEETISLAQLPTHNHGATFTPGASGGTLTVAQDQATTGEPQDGYVLGTTNTGGRPINSYIAPGAVTSTAELAGVQASGAVHVDNAGSSQPINVMQPSLALLHLICTNGYYPPHQ